MADLKKVKKAYDAYNKCKDDFKTIALEVLKDVVKEHNGSWDSDYLHKSPHEIMDILAHYETLDAKTTTGILNGHEWVDLGLPSGRKWATCNVGANKPEEYGDYYAWGDISPKAHYDDDNYEYYERGYDGYERGYDGCLEFSFEVTEEYSGAGPYILQENHDAAKANWGDGWRTPNSDDFVELKDNCDFVWTKLNDVNGMLFTSRINGKTLFLPATGWSGGIDAGSTGNYWTCCLDEDANNDIELGPDSLRITDFRPSINNQTSYSNGFSIRPICYK